MATNPPPPGPRPDRKEASHARILASAGRGFRANGFGGLGVDGLARDAGVTSGAFYAHFKSKAEAFRAAVQTGIADLRRGIEAIRAEHPEGWRGRFIAFYLGDRRTAPLAESCALQSLTGEVARAEPETRAAFEVEFQQVLATLAAPDATPAARAEAIALLALLSGGVTLARAVANPALAEEIATAVQAAALSLGETAPGSALRNR
jgi:AcrR family transcriptional regulator